MTGQQLTARINVMTGRAAHYATVAEISDAIALVNRSAAEDPELIDRAAVSAAYVLITLCADPEDPEDMSRRLARQAICDDAHRLHRQVFGGLG